MWLWLFFALLFLTAALALAFFTWQPDKLLAVHMYLTGRNAENEMDAASYTFVRLTRRFCAIPAIVCLLIGIGFAQSAMRAAKERPENERHDQARFEAIRKHGVGALLSKQASGDPQNPASLLPNAPPTPRAPGK